MKPTKFMRLYDSVSRSKIELIDPKISIYNCGPTVYNDIHIGNLRPAITFDILIRFLKAINYQVLYVHNMTDIDDKIINQAEKMNLTELEVSQKYTKAYLDIMEQMHLLTPNLMPTVSTNIEGIIDYVARLIAKKAAYIEGDNVLFDVNRVANYGIISKQNLNQLWTNARESNQTIKQHEMDFVLWKKTMKGLKWPSPWNNGRPGWHTECAYFIEKYIGNQVTIHGGGMDLKFPHHENENAQNQALHNCALAQLWMHVGTITINEQKMSKSLNNFVLVKNLLTDYSADVIRFFFMQTHYHNPLNYDSTKMQIAQKEIEAFYRTINLARTKLFLWQQPLQDKATTLTNQFVDALLDDLNFPNVVSWLYELRNNLNKAIKNNHQEECLCFLAQLTTELKVLGFEVPFVHDQAVLDLITKWNQAVQVKNYVVADDIRKTLVKWNCL